MSGRNAAVVRRAPQSLGAPRGACLVALLVAGATWSPETAPGDEPTASRVVDGAAGAPLEFTRVHVPAGRLADVPLGTTRYVPMSAREFEAALSRLPGAGRDLLPAPGPVVESARYSLALARDGSLAGTVSFVVKADAGLPAATGAAAHVSLGRIDARAATLRTATGVGEAAVFGRDDGTLVMVTPVAGTYTCEVSVPGEVGEVDRERFALPLVPALTSSIALHLPPGVRPTVGGASTVRRSERAPADFPGGTVSWQIDTGPAARLVIALGGGTESAPPLAAYASVSIRGRQARHDIVVRPSRAWGAGRVRLEKDPEVRVHRVTVIRDMSAEGDEVSWAESEGGNAVVVDLPQRCLGGREPLAIQAVAPVPEQGAPLPMVRPPIADWAGGGIVVHVVPALSVAAVELENCMMVPPEGAARWPVAAVPWDAPASRRGAAGPETVEDEPGVLPTRLFLEEQAPRARVRLSLAPRVAAVDVARVTSIDLSPGVVVGRAACDVRVVRGEQFDLIARVTPGWFIDSVEAIAPPAPTELQEPSRRRDRDAPINLEWKVQRDGGGDVLRVGLTAAVIPDRGLGLRITGHRAGIAVGSEFSTADLDMVRFEGETPRSAVLDLRTSPETIVEFDRGPEPSGRRPPGGGADPVSEAHAADADPRLAFLMEEGTVRARTWAGVRAGTHRARLVRRRPPLDARTQVRLTVRDDRITESFTFECVPSASDIDSLIVRFSRPLDDVMEWSLLPPATGAVSARRLEGPEHRAGVAGDPGGERWLVELNPPARGAVTVRVARTVPFVRPMPVPLAWVDGATSGTGRVIVRNAGRVCPRVLNRRLVEVPSDLEAADEPGTVAVLSYDPATAFDDVETAAADLAPAEGDARAWAWRESTETWCHASGAVEHETVFNIDNRGRSRLLLGIPSGRRVLGILVDGVRLPLGERPAPGGTVPIEMPTGRTLVSLVVRTAGGSGSDAVRPGEGRWAAWRVEPALVTLDVPVLERDWRIVLPPELEIARVGHGFRTVPGASSAGSDWVARLLGASLRAGDDATGASMDAVPVDRQDDLGRRFRAVRLVPSGMPGANPGVWVIHDRVLAGAVVLFGWGAFGATLLLARTRPGGSLLVCLLTGVAALWIAAPLATVARAAWWGAVAAAWISALATGRRGVAARGAEARAVALGVVAALASAGLPARADEVASVHDAPVVPGTAPPPPRVFVTPIDSGAGPRGGEETALVPEELFRVLVRGEDVVAGASVRVLSVRVLAGAAQGPGDRRTPWRLILDVDADAGGVLLLDQTAVAARFLEQTLRCDGETVAGRITADGARLRVALADAGRHALSIEVEPAVRRAGDVETATIALPVAPAATLEAAGPVGDAIRAEWICERIRDGAAFAPAPRLPESGVFDVARSSQVRFVRSTVAGGAFAARPTRAESRNDVTWNLDACRVTAEYDIDPGDAIVRSFVVRAEPGLEWLAQQDEAREDVSESGAAGDAVSIRPLGDGRLLVERRRPTRGRFRCRIEFGMPLADPVGVFDVPGAWIEDTLFDARTVRFTANPSLAVQVDLPAGVSHASLPEGERSSDMRSWGGEVRREPARNPFSAAVDGLRPPGGPASAPPGARLTVQRRRQEVRGSQRQSILFGNEQILLELDARIDATTAALFVIPLEVPAGGVVDRVALVEDGAIEPETAERDALDLRWTRVGAGAVEVVVQRPRAGRFRLEVAARLPGPPPVRGRMPCLRARLAEGTRTLVAWRTQDALEAVVARADAVEEEERLQRAGQFELAAGDTPPDYRLVEAPAARAAAEPEEGPVPAVPTAEPVRAASDAARVELSDIRLVADERGRAWGLAAFELVAEDATVRILLPRSWRLFDAAVDGRDVAGVVPVPAETDNVWELKLLDPRWPHRLVVLFAGELFVGQLGRRVMDGQPLELSAPAIVGMPCRRTIWTLQLPAGVALRVAAPASIVTPESLQAERRAARARVLEDLRLSLMRTPGWDDARTRLFIEASAVAGDAAVDRVWARAVGAGGRAVPPGVPISGRTSILVGDEAGDAAGQLTIRAVQERDPSVPGRALATLALLSCGGLAWGAALRPGGARLLGRLAEGLAAAAWVGVWGPLAALVAGGAWLRLLAPAWPGAVLIAAAVAGALRSRWRTPGERPPPDIALATTIYRPRR